MKACSLSRLGRCGSSIEPGAARPPAGGGGVRRVQRRSLGARCVSEMDSITCYSQGEEQTLKLGRVLGHVLEAGAVVALMGELGAGKTRLAQGIAEGLEVPRDQQVRSPSFALIHEHYGRLPLYHMDFYRLEAARWEPELGVEDYLWGWGVCVIEWADRIPELLPSDYLEIRIRTTGHEDREIRLIPHGEEHGRMLANFINRAADLCEGPPKDRTLSK
jgi:tRNA threonylcarbamoyladenosine biosynthesis protein TsaE